MNQFIYGLLLLLVLALPPVSNLLESIMIVHMHMQMPLLVIAGYFMGKIFLQKFPSFFQKWNKNGLPGILLFSIIIIYWIIPRAMDDALTMQSVQLFKFVSLPFLAGVPLRDSWPKLSSFGKYIFIISFTVMFFGMGLVYILSPEQLCNNYLLVEQITLGWGFITMAVCMVVYLAYKGLINADDYE